MTWNLTSAEVVKHWDLIKWGAYQVNKPPDPEKYFIGLLKNILKGDAQVWFLANGERQIKALVITKITQNIAGEKELLLDTLYGYSPMTIEERREGFEVGKKFVKTLGLSAIVAYTSLPQVGELAKSIGMVKINEVYKMNIGAN
jgi:hypothetical protein